MAIPNHIVDFYPMRELLVNDLVHRGITAARSPNSAAARWADLFAGIGVYANAGNLVALREGYLSTAQRKTSVLVGAKSLGVRLRRKIPAKVEVALERLGTSTVETIPAYSQFIIDGSPFFSRHDITFPLGARNIGGVDSNLFLYSGEVFLVEAGLPDSSNFETLELNVPAFNVSDVDVAVYVNGKAWSRVSDSLFLHDANDEVFLDETTYAGKFQVIFGNGLNGKKPTSLDYIQIMYVKTRGAADNAVAKGLDVAVPGRSDISGVAVTDAYGGQDEPDYRQYKFIAPQLARIGKTDSGAATASTSTEHESNLYDYPNVTDVVVLGQQELIAIDGKYNHPGYMNHLEVIVLPAKGYVFSKADKNEICALTTRISKVARMVAMTYDATPVAVDISVSLYISADAQKGEVEAAGNAAVVALFERRKGRLWNTITAGDVEQITAKIPAVVRAIATINSPETLLPWEFLELKSLKVEAFPAKSRGA